MSTSPQPISRILLGFSNTSEPIAWNPDVTANLLLVGSPDSGRAELAHTIIKEAAARNWQLALLNPGYGLAAAYSPYSESAEEYVDYGQLRETEEALARIECELNRRLSLLADHKVGSYLLLPADVRPTRLLVLFDDFDQYAAGIVPVEEARQRPVSDLPRIDAMNGSTRRAIRTLFRIASVGRNAGIFVIITGRRIDRDLLREFPGGLAFLRRSPKILLGVVPVTGVVSAMNEREASAFQKLQINHRGLMHIGDGLYESPTADGLLSVIHARLDRHAAPCEKESLPGQAREGVEKHPTENGPHPTPEEIPDDGTDADNESKEGIAFFYADKDLAKSLALGVAAVSLALAAVATMFARRR